MIQSDERTVEWPRWSEAMGFVVLCLANVFSTGFSTTRDALHDVSIHRVFFIRR